MTDNRAIVCFGDSITFMAASRADRGYPPILDEALFEDGYTVGNHAAGGSGFQSARDAYDAYYRNRGLWGACLLTGVNDLAAGTSANTIFAGINAFVSRMLSDGLCVVVSTVLPWKDGGGWTRAIQSTTESLNSKILGLRGTNSCLRVVDGYTEFADAEDSELLARCYQETVPDALHIGSYGAQVMAGLMRAEILELGGVDLYAQLTRKINQMSDSKRFWRAHDRLAREALDLVEALQGDS